jgi:hypothetical protein
LPQRRQGHRKHGARNCTGGKEYVELHRCNALSDIIEALELARPASAQPHEFIAAQQDQTITSSHSDNTNYIYTYITSRKPKRWSQVS